jgi:putative transposase
LDQSQFVTFTCYRRLRHLDDAGVHDVVVAAIEQARTRYEFRVYGFVIMPEHASAGFRTRAGPANAVQSLKIASAKRASDLRRFQQRRSPLWQKRYYAATTGSLSKSFAMFTAIR